MKTKQFEINLTCADRIQSVKELIKNEINSGNLKVVNEIWRSKYNEAVVYDWEPFCTEGFKHILLIESESNYYDFFDKLLKDTMDKYLTLEKVFGTTDREVERQMGLR